MAHQVMHKSLQ